MYNKNNYSTKKQKVIYDRQKYYIYYQLADENNRIRIIKYFTTQKELINRMIYKP